MVTSVKLCKIEIIKSNSIFFFFFLIGGNRVLLFIDGEHEMIKYYSNLQSCQSNYSWAICPNNWASSGKEPGPNKEDDDI